MTHFILQIKTLGSSKITRIYFNSKKPATEFIGLTKLYGYKMYQYIQSGNNYVMTADKLETENIQFEKLFREKKPGLGFQKKL